MYSKGASNFMLGKMVRYELIYIKFAWFFILMGFAYKVLSFCMYEDHQRYTLNLMFYIAFFVISSVINYTKFHVVKKGLFDKNIYYYTFRLLELSLLCLGIVYLGMGQWVFLTIAIPIIITCLCRGLKLGLWFSVYSFSVHTLMIVLGVLLNPTNNNELFHYFITREFIIIAFSYLNITLITLLCGMIYKDMIVHEYQSGMLMKQLGEKYEQLSIAQEEIRLQFENSKCINVKLEESNKKLINSIAEFYTLQQVSQAISSIYGVKELLKSVNDIIIGVMGVNNSSIILVDHNKENLKIHTTNIRESEKLSILNENINCEILLDVLNSGKPLIENRVDQNIYKFAQGRDVHSVICVPFNSKTKTFGLILVEHKFIDAFNEDNIRLLDVIGKQVGIAMENAELYQQMQDLASIDGLSGVYNRLYFQERLKTEFMNAQNENYSLCLTIFDVDHFKRFNDTFGHLFGDKVIREIAKLVKDSLSESDIIARYGGEEFVILFPRKSLKEAYQKVEELREIISKTCIKDNLVVSSVTASFGISCYPEDARTKNELLRNADIALYEAKASGRNCVVTAKQNTIYSS